VFWTVLSFREAKISPRAFFATGCQLQRTEILAAIEANEKNQNVACATKLGLANS
jgi:hypothetical protein